MELDTDQPPEKVYRLARRLAIVSSLVMVLAPLIAALIWGLFDRYAADLFGELGLDYDGRPVPPLVRLGCFLATMIPVGILIYGLFHLRRMFRACAHGQFFSAESILGLRRFALSLLAMTAVIPFVHGALTGLLTLNHPGGDVLIKIPFTSEDFGRLFLALLLVVITHILAEGRRIAIENDSFL